MGLYTMSQNEHQIALQEAQIDAELRTKHANGTDPFLVVCRCFSVVTIISALLCVVVNVLSAIQSFKNGEDCLLRYLWWSQRLNGSGFRSSGEFWSIGWEEECFKYCKISCPASSDKTELQMGSCHFLFVNLF